MRKKKSGPSTKVNLSAALHSTILFEPRSDISIWNVQSAIDMDYMFFQAINFSADLSSWKTPLARSMVAMFAGAVRFEADLSQWNVEEVENFFAMFAFLPRFNSDLSSWRLRSAQDVSFMFQQTTSFNQNLCTWGRSLDPSVNTDEMFTQSSCPLTDNPNFSLSPPGPLCFECVDSDTTPPTLAPSVPPPECFSDLSQLALAVDDYVLDPSGSLTAQRYGHPIGEWCVSLVTGFDSLFSTRRNPLVATFNENISGWQVFEAKSFFAMFEGAREFNQDLSGWEVSNSVDFRAMFSDCESFNQGEFTMVKAKNISAASNTAMGLLTSTFVS